MVEVVGKQKGITETNCFKNKEKCIACASVVYKEGSSLQDPAHVWFAMKEYGVGKHKYNTNPPQKIELHQKIYLLVYWCS